MKFILKACGIPVMSLKGLAADRVSWKSTCKTCLVALEAAMTQAAEKRRQHRHAAVLVTPKGPKSQHCGRICTSDFGLRRMVSSFMCPL